MKYFILLMLVLAGFVACKKEQPKLNDAQNACDCAEEVSADFKIEEATAALEQSWNRLTETDTILPNRNVYFTALIDDAEYTWYLGNQIITQKTFGRYFSDALIGQNISISLVLKKKPNNACFPNDDGYDSITKTFHVSEKIIDTGSDFLFPSMEGTYRMKAKHLADSFDVVIDLVKGSQQSLRLNIENYDGEGSDCIGIARPTGLVYRQIFSEGTSNGTAIFGGCERLRGNIHRLMNGKTKMYFTLYYESDPEDYEVLEYEGRKL